MAGPRVNALSIALALILYAVVLVVLAWRTGATVDEPAHILSSILYWEGQDKLEPSDMPPVIKIAGGWAAAEAGFPIVEESNPIWNSRHEWIISQDMIRRLPAARTQSAFFRARLPMLVFPIGCVALLWWWARQLVPPIIALIAALVFILEPTALGHAPLYKNDLAATFGYLLFWYRAWRFLQQPSIANGAWLGFGASVAMLTKLSMLLVLGLAPIIVLLAIRRTKWVNTVSSLALVWLIPYVCSLAAYQFNARRLTQFDYERDAQARSQSSLLEVGHHVARLVPIPDRLWRGFRTLVDSNAGGNSVYLLGERVAYGSRAYFVVAALVKSPEILLILLMAGVAVMLFKWRSFALEDLAWIVPGPLYFALASSATLQLGFRLVLPCLPFAILFAVQALRRLPTKAAIVIPAVLLVQNLWIWPHQIAFFNLVSGGPTQATRYLSGSNVDWGQDVRALRDFMASVPNTPVNVAYFGTDNHHAYLGPLEPKMIPLPYEGTAVQERIYRPAPGIYAISVTLLTGQFLRPEFRDYFQLFRQMQPVNYAGYSIYIYRVP